MALKKKKVAVAMSGGVDSSVAAILLLEQGYDVFGVTMKVFDKEICTPDIDQLGDAARVAQKLGIQHYILDFRKIFEREVIDYFAVEYARGRTPNPCIACNRHIKFQALLEKAISLGADFIATGHYARVGYSREYRRYIIRRSIHLKKDQTYVLYGLRQHQIARTLMPLGDHTKEQVRQIAGNYGLPVADKAESQDICFVFNGKYHDLIKTRLGNIIPGPFLSIQGEIIGKHRGIPFYTIGQRRGLGVATGERLYVIKIDPDNNSIVLGTEESLLSSGLLADDPNLILYERLSGPIDVEVQVRYNARPVKARLIPRSAGCLQVLFDKPQRAITPGQAVVFYKRDFLVGGATIESVIS